MGFEEIKKIISGYKGTLARKYHVNRIGIFGSYVRNEQTKNSDLDVLVDFDAPISMFEFIDMEDELSGLLGVKVDLVSRKALKPYIGKKILDEVQNV